MGMALIFGFRAGDFILVSRFTGAWVVEKVYILFDQTYHLSPSHPPTEGKI